MSTPFITAADVIRSTVFDIDTPPPPRYTAGPPFAALDIRPGRVLILGAPPASGKTACVLQIVAGILHHQPDVRAVFGCVEMSPADLLARVVGRLAGVSVEALTDKTLTDSEKDRVRKTLAVHAGLFDRLSFLPPPFDLKRMAEALDGFGATVAVVDYLQRFGHGKELRESLDGVMTGLRSLAMHGAAVIAVSSMSRQKDRNGSSSYAGLGMASFRGSSEIEFGADSAYILDADTTAGIARLRCEKARHRMKNDIPLRFNGELMQFSAGDVLDGFDAAPEAPNRKGAR